MTNDAQGDKPQRDLAQDDRPDRAAAVNNGNSKERSVIGVNKDGVPLNIIRPTQPSPRVISHRCMNAVGWTETADVNCE